MNVYKITLVAMFASLTAVGAFIKIPIPYLPITLQVFFVFLAGILLGPRLGALSQIVYLTLGLVGLPIFAEGGGLGYVFHPSFGFIIGFVFVSFFVGYFLSGDEKLSSSKTLVVCIIGVIILYIIGVPYMNIILNKVLGIEVTMLQSFMAMATLYLPGDILKVIGVALIAPRIKAAIKP
ncbi:biotin transporter BioY [Desulfitibacter alkalitolerans]|uniref:biotin transporter BioY n=1 Tax=Desulfitibacter alkalitolerans TaxID=264641 RepID=UPI000488A8EF|nr:biotin transporter BioY [Desulfitibacter alkalitolerans]